MNAKRGIIVLGLLSAASMPTWAQQIKGVVIDQKSKEIAKVSQTSNLFFLTLTMRHPSWIFLFFGGRIVTFAPV